MTQAQPRPSAYSTAFYTAQALRERNEGDVATLGHVRAKHHRAADAWQVLANRADARPVAMAAVTTLIDLPNENPDRIER